MADTTPVNARTVLFGSRGMVGSALSRHFTPANLNAYTHQQLDITDYMALEKVFLKTRPELVINAAAFTRVDDCEKMREVAFVANAQAPGNIAALCKKYNAVLVHFSTDYVFDGEGSEPYHEDSPVNPVNYYGATKLEGEKRIQASGCQHLILRTCWIFGRNGDNFVEKILKRALAGAKLRVPEDQTGTPTYTDDLAQSVIRLLTAGARGIFHFSNSGHCSRFEQTQTILKLYGLSNPVDKVKNQELLTPAKRPTFSVLDMSKYIAQTGHTPRTWQESTAEYVSWLKENDSQLRS